MKPFLSVGKILDRIFSRLGATRAPIAALQPIRSTTYTRNQKGVRN